MKNVHVMIETRLIHGQVGIQWAKYYDVQNIWVVNDAASTDEIAQKVMKLAVPSGCSVKFLSVKECQMIPEGTLILVNSPQDVLTLFHQGIDFREVLIRNMEENSFTHQVAERVHVTVQDIQAFCELKEKGIACTIKRFPDAVIEDSSALFEIK